MQATQTLRQKPMASSNRFTAMLTDTQKDSLAALANLRNVSMSQTVGDLIDAATEEFKDDLKALEKLRKASQRDK